MKKRQLKTLPVTLKNHREIMGYVYKYNLRTIDDLITIVLRILKKDQHELKEIVKQNIVRRRLKE